MLLIDQVDFAFWLVVTTHQCYDWLMKLMGYNRGKSGGRFRLYLTLLLVFCALSVASASETVKNSFFYEVQKSGESLVDLAMIYYGQKEFSEKIALWNKISKSTPLEFGQLIILKDPIYLPEPVVKNQDYAAWLNKSGLEKPIRYRLTAKKIISSESKYRRVEDRRKSFLKKERLAINTIWAPTDAENNINLGEKLYHLGKYQQAWNYFSKAIDAGSNSVILRFYRMNILKRLNRLKEYSLLKQKVLLENPQLKDMALFKGSFYQP